MKVDKNLAERLPGILFVKCITQYTLLYMVISKISSPNCFKRGLAVLKCNKRERAREREREREIWI